MTNEERKISRRLASLEDNLADMIARLEMLPMPTQAHEREEPLHLLRMAAAAMEEARSWMPADPS